MKKWLVSMLTIVLFLTTGSVVLAKDKGEPIGGPMTESISGKAYENPVLQKQYLESINYGDINISENTGMFTASSTYDPNNWTLYATTPTEASYARTYMYGVVKLYVSNVRESDGGRVVAAESDANIQGRFWGTNDGSGGILYYHSGITRFKWFVANTNPQTSVTEWAPQGTQTVTTGQTIQWSINPQILGNSIGSISGSFPTSSDKLTGTATTTTYSEEWSKSSGSVHWPDPVYLGGAASWYVPDSTAADFNWNWDWSWLEYREY